MHGVIRVEEWIPNTTDAAIDGVWGKPVSAVAFTASFPHTLFKDISCKFNGVELHENASSAYFLKAYIEQFLSYNDSEKETILEMQRYYEDTTTSVTPTYAATAAGKGNFEKRAKLAKGGKDVHFATPLYLDVMSTLRLVLPGTAIKLEFTR